MAIVINGAEYAAPEDVRVSLLNMLREQVGLTGTKVGCNQGACGACTVLIDGQRVLACLTLAIQCEGRDVMTIEGVGEPESLHRLQQAFVDHDGLQCGYCTPGQICSALAMMEEVRQGAPSYVTADLAADRVELDSEEIRERMSGNLCRCGAYNGIVAAITETFAEAGA
jgi:xanthine dehydrogenase YagT iron-sulfur-binding subunit